MEFSLVIMSAPARRCSGLLRGTRVQRKTADQQWDNEFFRKCRGVPWMLIGEEPEETTSNACSDDAYT